MKIRIQLPEHLAGYTALHKHRQQQYIDDILLWGMEIEMEVEHYTTIHPKQGYWKKPRTEPTWLVFIVEPEHQLMFALKWGATQHKGKKKHADPVL